MEGLSPFLVLGLELQYQTQAKQESGNQFLFAQELTDFLQ